MREVLVVLLLQSAVAVANPFAGPAGSVATLSVTNDWGSGFCAQVEITNEGVADIEGWEITLDLNGSVLNNVWGGVGSGYRVRAEAYNARIAPGASVSFGFCGGGSGRPIIADLQVEGGSGPSGSCSDGMQNQGETGVDCGGPCAACTQAASCFDGMQNQGETGVDCGGPCAACTQAASCSDGMQNQGETGVDCGGPCPACLTCSDDGTYAQGYATRYWDCCKPHCAWSENTSTAPANMCTLDDQPLGNANAGSACSGGPSFQCSSYVPWTVSSQLAYGYAATSSGDVCGRCYEVVFTGEGHYGYDPGSAAITGKRMIVQAINIGYDVGGGQFDLLVPGGGVGIFDACSEQWNVSTSELGQQYGGFLAACKQNLGYSASKEAYKSCVRQRCTQVFRSRGLSELEAGCSWFVDWFEAADNPNLRYREVACPAELQRISGMARAGSAPNSCGE